MDYEFTNPTGLPFIDGINGSPAPVMQYESIVSSIDYYPTDLPPAAYINFPPRDRVKVFKYDSQFISTPFLFLEEFNYIDPSNLQGGQDNIYQLRQTSKIFKDYIAHVLSVVEANTPGYEPPLLDDYSSTTDAYTIFSKTNKGLPNVFAAVEGSGPPSDYLFSKITFFIGAIYRKRIKLDIHQTNTLQPDANYSLVLKYYQGGFND
jgi:hypothetical protein